MPRSDRDRAIRRIGKLILLAALLCVLAVSQYLGGRAAGLVIHVLAVALVVTGPGLVALLLARTLISPGLSERLSRSPAITFFAGMGVIVLGSGLAALFLHLAGKLGSILKALSLLG